MIKQQKLQQLITKFCRLFAKKYPFYDRQQEANMIKRKHPSVFVLLIAVLSISACQKNAVTPVKENPNNTNNIGTVKETEKKESDRLTISDIRKLQKVCDRNDYSCHSDKWKAKKETDSPLLRGVFFPELNTKYSRNGLHGVPQLFIINNKYYMLIYFENRSFDEKKGRSAFLIGIEDNTMIDSLSESDVDKIENYAVPVDSLTSVREAVFLQGFRDGCLAQCNDPYVYDLTETMPDIDIIYLFGSQSSYTKKTKRGKKEALDIGYYSLFSDKRKDKNRKPESIIVDAPVSRMLHRAVSYKDHDIDVLLRADFVSNINFFWVLSSRKVLVRFDESYPFLFMVLDMEKGFNIPENKLDRLHVVDYETVYNIFGKYTDPVKRGNDLSNWVAY